MWRIEHEVRRAVLARDPEAAAVRTAAKAAARDVALEPLRDGQASVVLTGPAVPLTRWYATLDARARALRSAGDPRPLAALRFDLATSTSPCLTHPPADDARSALAASAGLRLSGVEAAPSDCRRGRPVQAVVVVPVETALGLSNEPAWLDGYGWLDAPTTRLLLPDAELRRLCVDGVSGQVLDLAARDVRPPPTPVGVRQALVDMVTGRAVLSDAVWRSEPAHHPSPALRDVVALRDRMCDGPTQPRTAASRCDADHDRPYPHGPTAAWNLVCRSRRTHALKHYGWTPVRTATRTVWTSPAGQVVEVPHPRRPAPGADADPTGRSADLPEADELASVDADQLTAVDPDDQRPWLPVEQGVEKTEWGVLAGSAEAPPF